MIFRYGGPDVVDYQEADWVEMVDSDNRTIRIAIARDTHLPIRKTVDTRDANTRMRTQEVEYLFQLPSDRRRPNAFSDHPRTQRHEDVPSLLR